MDSENYPSPEDPTTASKDAPTTGSDDANMEGETFLVPKSALGEDYPVGHICKVKIVHAYDDEYELKKVGDDESAEKTPDDESMEGAMSKMDSLGTDSM